MSSRPPGPRKACVKTPRDLPPDLRRWVPDVQPDHFAARSRESRHLAVSETDDAVEHVLLGRLEGARFGALLDEDFQLFLGDRRLQGRFDAEKPERQIRERLSTHDTGAAIQQSICMGRAVKTAILSGVRQADALGHQFAEEQREKSDGQHHQPEAQRARIGAREERTASEI